MKRHALRLQLARPTGAGSPSNAPGTAGPNIKPSLRQRLRYRFDTALSRGPSVVIGWLGLITLAVILVAALVLTVFRMGGVGGGPHLGLMESFWQSLLRVLDSGTFAGDTSWPTRLVGLLITVAGIFLAGSLIGLIANAVDQQISELRKGRSDVLETDHTLILGWSERVPPIIAELVIANESRPKAAIVVLATADKTEMEDAVRRAVPELRTTRVICRSGEPWVVEHLEMANLAGARSVVIVGGMGDPVTVKSLLAMRASEQSAGAGHRFHGQVVAEVESKETAESLESLLGERLVTVRSTEVVANLTAQACRQRGLSAVFRELLDFDGDEIYMAPFDSLAGTRYDECQLAFEKCAVIGVLDGAGVVHLNPSADRRLTPDDQLIAIAEDDSLFVPGPVTGPVEAVAGEEHRASRVPRRIVIAGWSRLGRRVVEELDEFFDDATTVEILLDPAKVDIDAVRAELVTRKIRIEISSVSGGPETIAAHAARIAFHEVIVLGYRDALLIDEADARTLLTLIAFRQVRQREDVGPVRIVAELLDQRNARLAQASGVDDFIVSDELTSLMLAQLSERGELNQVFTDLFDRDGCSIELRPASWYGVKAATTFATIVRTGSAMGVSVIGYRRADTGDVVVNPAKSAPLHLDPADEIVIIGSALAT